MGRTRLCLLIVSAITVFGLAAGVPGHASARPVHPSGAAHRPPHRWPALTAVDR